MATSTITFNSQLTGTSQTEYYCDLPFTPPSNLAGKLCYVQAKAFSFPNTWSGAQSWNTLFLYADWPQVQAAQVDFNPSLQDSGSATCTATNGSTAVTLVNPAVGYTVGSEVRGTGFATGTTMTDVSGSSVTLSSAYTGTTGTSVAFVFFNSSGNERQLANGPVAAFNGISQLPFRTLIQMPSGPHRVRFTVRRADKGRIANSSTTSQSSMFVIFEMVAAAARQANMN